MRPIDADGLKKCVIKNVHCIHGGYERDADIVIASEIDRMSTILEIINTTKGSWEQEILYGYRKGYIYHYRCTHCGENLMVANEENYKFCPFCGSYNAEVYK